MALTPEEEKELASLEQEFSQEQQPLSADEEAELQSLELQEQKGEAESSFLGGIGANIRSVSSGMLPGQNQISAALSAAADYVTNPITDKILGTETELKPFSERYTDALQQIKEQDIIDQNLYPVSTTVSNLAGNVVGMGKAAKLVGAAGKGMAALAASDAGFLAAQSISENNTLKGAGKEFGIAFAGDIAIQAALGPLGQLAKPGINTISNAADKMLLKSAINRVTNGAAKGIESFTKKYPDGMNKINALVGDINKKNIGDSPESFNKAFSAALDDVGQNVSKAYDELDFVTGGLEINPKELINKINFAIEANYVSEAGKVSSKEIKDKITNMLYDSNTGEYYVKSIKDLFEFRKDFNKIASNNGLNQSLIKKIKMGPLSDVLKSTRNNPRAALINQTSFRKPLIDALEKEQNLSAVVSNIEETIKLQGSTPALNSRLAEVKAELMQVKNVVKDAEKQGVTLENISKTYNKIDQLDNDIDPLVLARDKVNKLSEEYEMMASFKDDVLSVKPAKTFGGTLVDLLKDRYVRVGVGAALGASAGGLGTAAAVGLSAASARSVAKGIESFSGLTTQGLAREAGQKLSKTLMGIADNPNDPVIRAIGANIARNVVSEDSDSDASWANIEAEMSKYNLYQNPVERTERDTLNKFNDIMAIASVTAPQLAVSLAQMQNNQEDIGPVMDQLSKEPSMMKFFAGGLGWDGKVYSPEDKALLVSQINDRFDIPAVKRKELSNLVMSTGEIPNLNEVATRKPIIYKPRDRSKER